ncbi:MAG: hypothetical protein FMNOHCHN_01926 [Ignavibacteriaceae bacterium]|nr:hypothetical protein [Ignavibacteriaceae bacterium]
MPGTMSLKDAAAEFLSYKRIAVAGVSRTKKDAANLIYTTLRKRGYQVYAVNPHAEQIEGDYCFSSLADIPGGAEALVIALSPEKTDAVAREAVNCGIKAVWMHKSFGDSVSESAAAYCREKGLLVIPGGCPMMFSKPVDFGHLCIRGILGAIGRIPGRIPV